MNSLRDYSKKRNFKLTPEPPAAKAGAKGRHKILKPGEQASFFVQRHDASRLHFDFRLELEGTLKSWAVPKGPTLDPTQRRLAVMVEDHPISYGTFEGNIPKGEYGGGSVLLWDRGTFTLLGTGPSNQQLEAGNFKFSLDGEKLHGEFALVRLKNSAKENEWLLLKKSDRYAQPGWSIESHNKSVATGRRQDAIAMADSTVKKVPMPTAVEPMLAQLNDTLPEGDSWVYEIKWDGVRSLCFLSRSGTTLQSRSGGSYDKQFPELNGVAKNVKAKEAIIDGEIVAVDENGLSHFEWLQSRIPRNKTKLKTAAPAHRIMFFAFDLLYIDGADLRGLPLVSRRKRLEEAVSEGEAIKLSTQFSGPPNEILRAARELGLEGLIAKRLDSVYSSGRSGAWRKVKLQQRQEFVICGWIPGKRKPFGALAIGLTEAGKLRWCGNVGTGFDAASLAKLGELLSRRIIKSPPPGIWPKEMVPVKPNLICEVKFLQWTASGKLRAPVYLGLRADLKPLDVKRETAQRGKLLAGKADSQSIEVDSRLLHLTHLNKIYFPSDGFTKRDLLNYYAEVSPYLLPYLKDRPLSLRRYPDGILGESFFQKNLPASAPAWMETISIGSEKGEKPIRYCLCPDLSTLLYLVNLGCIDHNPWMSRTGNLDSPDYLLIDLDANGVKFAKVIEAAWAISDLLREVSLSALVKTSGGDGLHLLVPLEEGQSYARVRQVGDQLAAVITARFPKLLTMERSLAKRPKGRVYFDNVQIGKGKTVACPYSIRPYAKAPVSTPLRWDDLVSGIELSHFHIGNTLERLENGNNPWLEVENIRYRLGG